MPDLLNYQNDLLDPLTKQPVRIDQRLLNEQLWLKQPKLVHRLLEDTAAQATDHGLATLAESYLATTGNPLYSTTGPETEPDYFLVLGNALNEDASPRPELVTRLKRALVMSQANPAARLMVSGGAQVRDVKESDVMKNWLTDRGVGAQRIVVESQSLDTVENIEMSTDLLTKQNAKRVGLITGIKGAGRAAYLLPTHLKHVGSTIETSHVPPAVFESATRSHDDLARERFLLFKDLGRILGIWKYRGWARSAKPQSA